MTDRDTRRAEWIANAMADLDQAAAMLLLEANEWRERARLLAGSRKKEDVTGRTCGQMLGIAAANDGMARQLIKRCQAMTDLLKETTDNTEGA